MALNLHLTGALANLIPAKKVSAIQIQIRHMLMPGTNLQQRAQTDLLIACKSAISDQTLYPDPEEHHPHIEVSKGKVPVFMMLPLDMAMAFNNSVMVNENEGYLRDRLSDYKTSFMKLKNAGVEGVMVDIWWGLVERDGPSLYNWSGYTELMEMLKKVELNVQAVMSFHQCGGNVGDSLCQISLPKWVVEEMDRNTDLCYSDQWGCRNYEYVSLGCDTLPLLKGRTPIQCYADFMQAFRDQFSSYLGTTIVEVQVGMGPAGELRYPSYPESNSIWKYPGIGAFQCYDKYMLENLKKAALSAGKPEWGHSGPTDAGDYNKWPHETGFFCEEGAGWNGPYGDFFLSWYSCMLLNHADLILCSAVPLFCHLGVKISIKVAGIHWHYGTGSHAPELTAGYYNTRYRDGYLPIARILARHGAVLNFTCLEMRDCEQREDASCRPEALIQQVVAAAKEVKVALAAENALPRYDDQALEQIVNVATTGGLDNQIVTFTYLRMDLQLFEEENWNKFVAFVARMRKGQAC